MLNVDRKGRDLAVFLLGMFVAAILVLAVASARGADSKSVLRAHLTPEAMTTWLTDTTKWPDILDCDEIDNSDPKAVTARVIEPARILTASWESHGETETTTGGVTQAVIDAKTYTLKGGN